SVETSVPPDFQSPQKFKCLSPIVVSGKHFHDGREHEYFLRGDDENLSAAIRKNLIHKFHLVHQKAPENDALEFSLDPDYVRRKGGVGKISKLITIKENHAAEATHIKAFESLFYLDGSTELMQIAWECGIGQRNSMGFGMIGVI
ncbi:MAG: CRISPR-associated endoribonuclease Cas6, partial [Candidatus Lokiarchaeota archaeon]|nr:CRISPR-associated endoribonuclease Cas6 [Candidatus Lokiarchaeota archaeon]